MCVHAYIFELAVMKKDFMTLQVVYLYFIFWTSECFTKQHEEDPHVMSVYLVLSPRPGVGV